MKKDIKNLLRAFDKNLVPEFQNGTLENLLQSVYSTSQRMVLHGYFEPESRYSPKNPGLLLIPYYTWGNQYGAGKINVGAAIFTKEKVKVYVGDQDEDFEFSYVDKFGVIPRYQKNGYGDRLFNLVRKLMAEEGMGFPTPAILRTSVPEAHEWYSKRSDIQTVLFTENGQYYLHGFGFLEKDTKNELMPYASAKFHAGAAKAASKPVTVMPIQKYNHAEMAHILKNGRRNGTQELG